MKQYLSNLSEEVDTNPAELRAGFGPQSAPLSLAGIEIHSDEEGLIHQFGTEDYIPAPAPYKISQPSLTDHCHSRAGLRLGSGALFMRDSSSGQQLSIPDAQTETEVSFLKAANPALSILRDHLTKSLLSMPRAQCTGLAGRTSVATPQGNIAIDQLRPGQHVLSQTEETRVVLGIARCDMSRLTQLCLPQFAPVFFPSSSVGIDTETCLAPDQPVCLSGPSVYYEFGEQEVYLRAKEFISQARSYQQGNPVDLTYYHVILDQPAVMRTEAHWVDSLNTSDVAPEWFSDMFAAGRLKTVAHMPLEMLQHPAPERRHLRRFEAQTLLAEMSRNF